ncbi:hypothetical protein [Plesiocystis pacifica]|uniref:hypothetical protein n=1 Tax=Plesiocystis pacifica TaxID=191768 RepID=UPI0002D3B97E|nr:hypothetical protein [Plesiocystis pacifica]
MKASISRIEFPGEARSTALTPGLNIITGPISTGKSQFLRLCRIVFGSKVKELGPEVRAMQAIRASLTIGKNDYTVYRPLTDTARAKIVVSTVNHGHLVLENEAKPYRKSETRYSEWLASCFGFQKLYVPSAPTRIESDPNPLGIRDYMMYCSLPKDEIASEVFSHEHPHKNIKRRYVFELLYGIYSAEIANQQSRLREIRHARANLEIQSKAIDSVYDDLPWGSSSDLESELQNIDARLQMIHDQQVNIRVESEEQSGIGSLRRQLLTTEEKIGVLSNEIEDLENGLAIRKRTSRQLRSQIGKLSRAMTATGAFGQYNYVKCPVCSQSLPENRNLPGHCALCLQPSSPQEDILEELVAEQLRISRQIDETEHLLEESEEALESLWERRTTLDDERKRISEALSLRLDTFVSDKEETLVSLAEERGRLAERASSLNDARMFMSRRGQIKGALETVLGEEEEAVEALEELRGDSRVVQSRIARLEQRMSELLSRMRLPAFLDARAQISRANYLPIVGGRTFGELLSEGLTVEVNIAHALAHQLVSAELNLGLPKILFIDSPSSAFGKEGFDPKRLHSIYEQIRHVCSELAGDLQVIIADNHVPDGFDRFIRLRLSEHERLVPS